MLDAIIRKARQLAGDPVLRRWLTARAVQRTPAEPGFTAHHPPYLGANWDGLTAETAFSTLTELPATPVTGNVRVRLAGATMDLAPGQAADLVQRSFADTETTLSLHRFAWVPLLDTDADPAWVGEMWRHWMAAHGQPDQSWAWHPYTAAERAINILTFAQRHGLPGPLDQTLACLAAHAPAMAAGLEWFGDHHTSNHCANNGRGLYLLGLALGLHGATEAGATILHHEARRIFRPSGVLREASSHYHLLMTRQWASVWLAARAHHRPEAAEFEAVLRQALAVLPHFALPGRFPLVGDVSPDCPPAHLFGLLPGGDASQGWTALLTPHDHVALLALRDAVAPVAADALRQDGWLRRDLGPWSGLWHAEPTGWSPMPGHGHQDCGGFELHYEGVPIFLDPGRGSYAQAGEADADVRASAHSTVTVDGADPYPPNRPYYHPSFRAHMAGGALLQQLPHGVRLDHSGYARFGIGVVTRCWGLESGRVTITDTVAGRGNHLIQRRLVTGLPVTLCDGTAILTLPSGRKLRVRAETAAASLEPQTLWTAYGAGTPGHAIVFSHRTPLPFSGTLIVEEF